ncbi:uncharacterized protein LOC129596187 isoform X2 [Paramacrobiotus metropolitanus]|uniref:uncharacterized protein LOC129596187 isoform X2 n=1 Tax=Paramacrobiotus metropolitanus TaxID=2943436 RepID=UPI002445E7AD|nr:uncharacterized protein LOC129596187 isoform X2 [Paramacrobiotus metropolitanus]
MSRFGSRFGSSDTTATAEATSEPRSRFGASNGAAEADPPKESRFGGSGGNPPPTRSRFGRSSDQPSGEESQESKIGGDRSGDDTGSRRSRFGGGGGSSQDQNRAEERKPSRFGQTDTGAGGNNSSSEGRRGGSRFGGGGDADDNRSDQPRSRFGNRDDGNRGGGSRFERNSEDRGDRQQNRGDREQGGFRGNRDEDRSDFRSGHNEHDDRSERPPRGGDGDRGERPARGGESGEGQESRPAPVNYVPPERPTERDDLRKEHTTAGINFKKYGNVPINVSGNMLEKPVDSFKQSGLHPTVLEAVEYMKYEIPTPIQKYCIPAILSGQDIMACAQTGSGKTAGYLLPIISRMLKDNVQPAEPTGKSYPQCLVLCPTRELASQVDKEAAIYTHGTGLKSFAVYGQTDVRYMANHLRTGVNIIAATTGRLKDTLERGMINLSNLQYLVLDEADRMLDMGFSQDIERIVENANMPKKENRLTLMFSATFPEVVQTLARNFLRKDYLFIATGILGGACCDVEQEIIKCDGRSEKREKLDEILEKRKELNNGQYEKTLIFVQTKEETDKLGLELACNNISSTTIHGGRTQEQREIALADFKSGRKAVLVATNVAARGLDIPDVKHVINWDLPRSADDMDEYVHRIGRTGRVGNQGMATTFYTSRDVNIAPRLIDILHGSGARGPDWLYDEAGMTPPAPTGERPTATKSFGAQDNRRFPADDKSEEQPASQPQRRRFGDSGAANRDQEGEGNRSQSRSDAGRNDQKEEAPGSAASSTTRTRFGSNRGSESKDDNASAGGSGESRSRFGSRF